MKIQQIENELGISRANIRFYERAGLFLPKRNPLNDYREYSNEDLFELKKILFLRSLEIPVEKIRLYQLGKIDLHSLIIHQKNQVEEKLTKSEEVLAWCETLINDENVEYARLSLPIDLSSTTMAYDQMMNKPFVYEVIATSCCFFFQILYTFSIFLLLPKEIPISWSGLTVIKTEPRLYIFVYIIITALFLLACRTKTGFLYSHFIFIRQDYFRALLSNLLIGLFLGIEVYIVYATQGFGISQDVFLTVWMTILSLLWLVGTLLVSQVRRYKKKKEED